MLSWLRRRRREKESDHDRAHRELEETTRRLEKVEEFVYALRRREQRRETA
jgi:hypothetical protein